MLLDDASFSSADEAGMAQVAIHVWLPPRRRRFSSPIFHVDDTHTVSSALHSAYAYATPYAFFSRLTAADITHCELIASPPCLLLLMLHFADTPLF